MEYVMRGPYFDVTEYAVRNTLSVFYMIPHDLTVVEEKGLPEGTWAAAGS